MDLDTEKQPKQNPTHLPIYANHKYTWHLHATFYIIKIFRAYFIIYIYQRFYKELRLHMNTAMNILIIK